MNIASLAFGGKDISSGDGNAWRSAALTLGPRPLARIWARRERASENCCLQRRLRRTHVNDPRTKGAGCARTQPRPAFIYYATRGAARRGRRGGAEAAFRARRLLLCETNAARTYRCEELAGSASPPPSQNTELAFKITDTNLPCVGTRAPTSCTVNVRSLTTKPLHRSSEVVPCSI
ncbi:hypothetical protein ACJJTC_012885 [Scirpophaga incertulas]